MNLDLKLPSSYFSKDEIKEIRSSGLNLHYLTQLYGISLKFMEYMPYFTSRKFNYYQLFDVSFDVNSRDISRKASKEGSLFHIDLVRAFFSKNKNFYFFGNVISQQNVEESFLNVYTFFGLIKSVFSSENARREYDSALTLDDKTEKIYNDEVRLNNLKNALVPKARNVKQRNDINLNITLNKACTFNDYKVYVHSNPNDANNPLYVDALKSNALCELIVPAGTKNENLLYFPDKLNFQGQIYGIFLIVNLKNTRKYNIDNNGNILATREELNFIQDKDKSTCDFKLYSKEFKNMKYEIETMGNIVVKDMGFVNIFSSKRGNLIVK